MPNYAATQPSDSSHRWKLESLQTGNSRLYVRVTLYRKRIKSFNCFQHEENHTSVVNICTTCCNTKKQCVLNKMYYYVRVNKKKKTTKHIEQNSV